MSVTLRAIAFNRGPRGAPSPALNLRRNGRQILPLPEWERGRSVRPEDSVVAYPVERMGRGPLTIRARLARTPDEPSEIEVRALQPPLPVLPEAPPGSPLALYLEWLRVLRTHVNVLGEVEARTVRFNARGDTGFQPFTLANTRLQGHGVGAFTVIWRWQYRREPADPWRDLAVTRHRVLRTLGPPTAPWSERPFVAENVQLPWSDVLEVACRWAHGARDRSQVAAAITASLYRLGGRFFEYGCQVSGMSAYSFPVFNCSAFLDRLAGGPGMGRFLNCSDCAAVVSTLSNALGCDLWQSEMGPGPGELPVFPVAPILALGSPFWQQPCGWPGFAYHEVAWEADCGVDDAVFDASLGLDGDRSALPPHRFLLATGLRFGRSGEGGYRDLLSPGPARELCEPRPHTRQRRSLV